MNSGRVNEYYNVVKFFYREPQHLDRSKQEKNRYRSFDEVLDYLRWMEVTPGGFFLFLQNPAFSLRETSRGLILAVGF